MRVIIRGNWSDCVGTDYCEALGIYDSLTGEAEADAWQYASDKWEPQERDYDEGEVEFEDEGPDYWIEEYDRYVHDDHRAGGGSFEDEFLKMENYDV